MSASASLLPGNQIVNPITQSGRVVLNARKDTHSIDRRVRLLTEHPNDPSSEIAWGGANGVHDENFSVLTHEIAVYDCTRDYELRLGGAESVPVVTSANGMTVENWDIASYTKGVTFMGIAGSRALHDSRNASRNEEDCTVQIGGLCTIVNNGGAPISVGEWVAWDYPEPDVYTDDNGEHVINEDALHEPILGTPFTKKQFRVRGYEHFLHTLLSNNRDSDARKHMARYDADGTNASTRHCEQARLVEKREHVLHLLKDSRSDEYLSLIHI